MKKSPFLPASIAAMALCSASIAVAQPADDAPGGAAPAQAQPSPPASSDPAAQAPSAQATPAAQLVDREFAAYDLDKSGQLDANEFAAWVAKLRKPSADGSAPKDSQQFSASLFARADTDHNKQVSRTEMTTLLSAAQG